MLEPAEPTPIEEDEELPQIEPVIVHDNTPQEHVLPNEADTAEGFQAGRSITTHVLTKEGPQQSMCKIRHRFQLCLQKRIGPETIRHHR